jgi:hypothetical protein
LSFFRSNCPAHSPLTGQRQSRSAEATCGSFLALWSSEALKELSLRLKRRLTVAESDQDLIGVTFKDADGRMLEVTGVHPKFPGAILYRDLTIDAEGTMLSIYVRLAKQREHVEKLKRESEPTE